MPLRDVPQQAIELIKSFEGIPDGDPSTVNLDAYLDPVGIWTIGWGHAIVYQGSFLRGPENKSIARSLYPGGITIAQAEALLKGELVSFARDVQNLVKVTIDDNQFGALISFAFNAGTGNLASSTLLRKLNAGDVAGAADQFLVWNKSRQNGVLIELKGLTRRRTAERAMFLGQEWREPVSRDIMEAPEPVSAGQRPEAPPQDALRIAAAAKKVAAKKAAAKKALAAKKAAAKPAVAKKAPAKKAAIKQAPAKKAPAKKAAAKKAPAKKAAAKKKAR
jgi:GH24 family phage-related lysozyme (muramidase)